VIVKLFPELSEVITAPEIEFNEIFKFVLVKTVALLAPTISRHAYVLSERSVVIYGGGIKLLNELG
jgi:hypothetical protein